MFEAALEKDPAARAPFLADFCRDDEVLRAEVDRLLAAHDRPQVMLDGGLSAVLVPEPSGATGGPARAPGDRLGRYEVLGLIGRGGMGEVYKARDPRLNRTVAIKVLADAVAGDAEHRARFEREARAISALEHPNICAVYDIGEENGHHFIVMQYLEGETLADRLTRGPLTIAQVIRHGIEIADALDKAHRASIVHRDLKPGNIMLTKSGAKLLDFGLATLHDAPGPLGLSTLTRLGTSLTAAGAILGTLSYMAPEQVEGREVDRRSDIFALGAVLYEAVSGRRPFDGPSPASVIGSILRDDPAPITNHVPVVPPALDQLVLGCLAKDPDERWQSTADVKRQLLWIGSSQSGSSITVAPGKAPARSDRLGWVVAALLATALALGTAFWLLQPAPTIDRSVVRFQITPPSNTTFAADIAQVPSTQLAMSPDGKQVAFVAAVPGRAARLWVREISSTEPHALTGTDDASYPFWSFDGKSIGFFARGKLKRIDVAGGEPLELCDVGANPRGGAWNQAGVIVFSRDANSGLSQVSAQGGTPATLRALGSGDHSYRWPSFLPDGRRFLFHVRASNGRSIQMGSLDGGESTPVLADAPYAGVYVQPGLLLTVRERTLFAYPFDESALPIVGDGTRIADHVGGSTISLASFSVSATGALAYAGPLSTQSRLEWFDRSGIRAGTPTDAADFVNFRLSPDGKRAALTRVDQKSDTTDIWLLDVSRIHLERFTDDPGTDTSPIWSPDGTRIMFRSDRAGGNFPFERPADRSAPERQVTAVETAFLTDWSSDGARIAFHVSASGSFDAGTLELTGGTKPTFVAPTSFTEMDGRFSPDRRWFAYSSDSSGRMEVYVAAAGSAGIRASIDGGSEPHWRGDSRELFYLSSSGDLMYVPVKGVTTPELGVATKLFSTKTLFPGSIFRMNYDVSADGQRFLVSTPTEGAGTSPITVVLNWTTGIQR
jgi:serine/threonine protein kinase/Tol biopolymer transport system component